MLLFIYIGVIGKNNLNSSIMKRVVLTLALAVIGLTTNAQRDLYAPGVYIDTTEEKGSFDNPYIVDSYKDADPYVWFYQENWNRHLRLGKCMYGMKHDMKDYAEGLIKEIGKGIYDYDKIETEYRIEWDVIEENGAHYTITLEMATETAELYINELSQEEHINVLKLFKKQYIKEYGEELVEKWLAY
jgi:hypothetical protein